MYVSLGLNEYNYVRHLSVKQLYKMQIYLYFSWENIKTMITTYLLSSQEQFNTDEVWSFPLE